MTITGTRHPLSPRAIENEQTRRPVVCSESNMFWPFARVLVALIVAGSLAHVESAAADSSGQSEQVRRVISDRSTPLPALIQEGDDVLAIQFTPALSRERGELHLRKTLSEELDDLSQRADTIAFVSVKSSRSFLTRNNTDVDTYVSIAVHQIVRNSAPAYVQVGREFAFLQGGGEIRIGKTRVRIDGYVPFRNGERYLMWFVKTSENDPLVAIDWMSVDTRGRLVNSAQPTWRDRQPGLTHLFGLPVTLIIDELKHRQQ
jgi:hypothetical protein